MIDKFILICDSETKVHTKVGGLLNIEGIDYKSVYEGTNLINNIKYSNPELILLDIMMPGIDRNNICKQIRKFTDTPIIILSYKSKPLDKAIGLELGADDYIEKPFYTREVVARIKAVLKRCKRDRDSESTSKNIEIDLDENRVCINRNNVQFSPKEIKTLSMLVSNSNTIITRKDMLSEIWCDTPWEDMRVVDSQIKRIRKKLKENKSIYEIETIYGVGYKLTEKY